MRESERKNIKYEISEREKDDLKSTIHLAAEKTVSCFVHVSWENNLKQK